MLLCFIYVCFRRLRLRPHLRNLAMQCSLSEHALLRRSERRILVVVALFLLCTYMSHRMAALYVCEWEKWQMLRAHTNENALFEIFVSRCNFVRCTAAVCSNFCFKWRFWCVYVRLVQMAYADTAITHHDNLWSVYIEKFVKNELNVIVIVNSDTALEFQMME